jgi:hypothetical protein
MSEGVGVGVGVGVVGDVAVPVAVVACANAGDITPAPAAPAALPTLCLFTFNAINCALKPSSTDDPLYSTGVVVVAALAFEDAAPGSGSVASSLTRWCRSVVGLSRWSVWYGSVCEAAVCEC